METTAETTFSKALDAIWEQERDRVPLWLPVMLGTGIGLWFVIPNREGWIALMLACGGLAMASIALLGRGRAGMAAAICFSLIAAGCALVWSRAELVRAPRIDRAMIVRFTGRIEQVELLKARGVVRLVIAPDPGQVPALLVRINVDDGLIGVALRPGQHVGVRARLLPPPDATLPGGYDFARIAWFRQIGATGQALARPERLGAVNETGFMRWIATLRVDLTAHILSRVPGSKGGIAAALVTGDQGGISAEDAQAMRTAGLAHLLSISGLHVAVVIGATMFIVLRILALSSALALRLPLVPIAAGAAAFAGIAYTLIAGAEVPTLRSCIAALLVLVGLAIGREVMALRLVASGALAVLLVRPEALIGPSFQMSFAAVAVLVALHENGAIKRWFKAHDDLGTLARWGSKVAEMLVTGVVIEIALVPIALFHFHHAGIYGAIANIVAIPLTSMVIMPIELLALVLDLAGLGGIFWVSCGVALDALMALAHHVARLPGAIAALPSMPVGAFGLIAMGGIWLSLWRSGLRWAGLAPILAGSAWAITTPAPLLLILNDGRHLAVRDGDGSLVLLRSRAGEFVKRSLAEAGAAAVSGRLDDHPVARCSADICVADVQAAGRRLRIMATRSPYMIERRALVTICQSVDIVVSDRRLPTGCRPRWLLADRTLLSRTGGLAISLSPFFLRTSRSSRDDHPWVMSEAIAASAKATAWLSAAKARRTPSDATADTRASIVPASGWTKRTSVPNRGRALVSRKAPLPEISRSAAGAGHSATSRQSLRRRHGVTMAAPELPPVML